MFSPETFNVYYIFFSATPGNQNIEMVLVTLPRNAPIKVGQHMEAAQQGNMLTYMFKDKHLFMCFTSCDMNNVFIDLECVASSLILPVDPPSRKIVHTYRFALLQSKNYYFFYKQYISILIMFTIF